MRNEENANHGVIVEPDSQRNRFLTATIVIAVLQLTTLILLFVFYPETDAIHWMVLIAFFILTLVLGGWAASITGKKLRQIDVQAIQPAKTESQDQQPAAIRDPLTNLFSRPYLEQTLEQIQAVVTAVRSIRAELNVPPGKRSDLYIKVDSSEFGKLLTDHIDYFIRISCDDRIRIINNLRNDFQVDILSKSKTPNVPAAIQDISSRLFH